MMLQASPALQPNVVLICSAQSEKKLNLELESSSLYLEVKGNVDLHSQRRFLRQNITGICSI